RCFAHLIQNLDAVEYGDIGDSVLAGILYRVQCVKLAKIIEQRRKGSGGQKWLDGVFKKVFERKKRFHAYSRKRKTVKRTDPKIREGFEQYKKDCRYLTTSRNRLMTLYDLVEYFVLVF